MPKVTPSKQVGKSKSKATPTKGSGVESKSGGKSKVPPFHLRLAQLTVHQAIQLLGDDGQKLIRESRKFEFDIESSVYLGESLLRVRVPDAELASGVANVTIQMLPTRKRELKLQCDQCELPCAHGGAAVSVLLEDKLLLGLSAPPDETVPSELLTPKELEKRVLDERQQRAAATDMQVRSLDTSTPWCDYVVTSSQSGKSYRVALRGEEAGQSYCSCPDFRNNRLGTCKHILHTIAKVRKRFNKSVWETPYVRENVSLRVHYGDSVGLRFNIPTDTDKVIEKWAVPYGDKTLLDAADAVGRVRSLEKAGHSVHIYPDAEAWIDHQLIANQLRSATEEIRKNPAKHPLRKKLLSVELLPYQMDGIAFAVGAGRAVLADDMGLGKTIQGIGTAELLAQLAGIERVLVVCPASLKSQWRDEITRFCGRETTLILGTAAEREEQYGRSFFTVCNYEQVLRDMTTVESRDWDLIILDEGQRIKNWESKTSQAIRSLRSRFALVLSGTPLENRLDELFTVVQFVDEHRLGPAHEFYHRHRVVDDNGRVQGYRNLDELRDRLQPILLRRTRGEVMKQLPGRTDTIVRVTPTEEQLELHEMYSQRVAKIVGKRYLTEMDLLQLQKYLLLCRMSADGTFLVDKEQPGFSSKLDRLGELLAELGEHPERKIVLFSEWKGMLDRIGEILDRLDMGYVRLDGSVSQKKRPALVKRFQEDADCRVIMMTNAGSTGLNLQSADTVINVDLPWNPAVLEQRIGRAYRMGQKRPVQIYNLVTEDTLEERLLDTLAAKQDLASASLDIGSEVSEVAVTSGIEELKRRLEKLMGPAKAAPVDESQKLRVTVEAEITQQRRDRVAAAGGQLLGAALQLVGDLVDTGSASDPKKKQAEDHVVSRLRSSLFESLDRDETGRPQLRITLDDDEAVNRIAESLAKLLVAGET